MLDQPVWERGTNREKRDKERIFRERDYNFSLKFPVTGPSNFGEPRDKVSPHGKSYAWTLVLWSFNKLWKVGVFSYLVYFRLKRHLKWFGWCEAESGRLISPKTNAEIFGTHFGQSRTAFGLKWSLCA